MKNVLLTIFMLPFALAAVTITSVVVTLLAIVVLPGKIYENLQASDRMKG